MNRKSILIYLLVFILAFVGFAFVCFPGKEAGRRLSETLNSKNPNLRVTIGKVGPALPFSLKFQDMTISMGNGLTIMPDAVKVSFSPISLFREEKQLKVRAELNQGILKGNLQVTRLNPLTVSGLELFLEKMEINGFQYHTSLAELTLNCEMSGEYREDDVSPESSSGKTVRTNGPPLGQGSLVMENFLAHMENSWLNRIQFSDLDFSSLAIDFRREPHRVLISRCVGRGSVINLKLSGELRLAPVLKKTRLNLTGKILPDSPYLAKFANQAVVRSKSRNITRNGIDFYIKGTLENPRIGI